MSQYGFSRLHDLTQEDVERRLHEILNRKDAKGNPDVMTVEDLRVVVDAFLDAMTQLDEWVLRNK